MALNFPYIQMYLPTNSSFAATPYFFTLNFPYSRVKCNKPNHVFTGVFFKFKILSLSKNVYFADSNRVMLLCI